MAETIVDGTQFNAQNVRYSAPKANAAGGKSVNILNSSTNSGLRIATPLMLTWGATEFEGNGKFEMSLQFPRGEYANADTDAFLRNMQALEAKVKAAHSSLWSHLHTSTHVSTRQHMSAHVSIRQHTSKHVSTRQHTRLSHHSLASAQVISSI
jgi:hypothetical protein